MWATAKKERSKISHLDAEDWAANLNKLTIHGTKAKGHFGKWKRQTFTDEVMTYHKKHKLPAPSSYENAKEVQAHTAYGKSDKAVKHFEFIDNAIAHSKKVPAPNAHKEISHKHVHSRSVLASKWPKTTAADEFRTASKMEKDPLGPGTHTHVETNVFKNKQPVNTFPKSNLDREYYGPDTYHHIKERKKCQDPHKYFKENDHAKKTERCLSKSPSTTRVRLT